MSSAAQFDKDFYLQNNLDVAVSISQGFFSSALQHFTLFGGKELRSPNALFDSQYYATRNSDVLEAVGSGAIGNVFEHFQQHGETESRAPSSTYASFDSAAYLSANTDVAAAILAGSFNSALDHFIAFGQSESREGSGVTIAPVTGSTFTLTNGANTGANFQGTANADTFDGSLNTNGTQTLTTLDSLDGGAGVDTLSAVFNTAGTVAATLSNIENVLFSSSAAVTLDLINSPSVVSVNSSGSTAAMTVNNIPSTATTVTITNTNQNHTLDFLNAAVTGTTDTAAVNVANVSAGALTVDNSIETLSITSSTNANTLASVAGNYGTLNILGDSDLTITAGDADAELIDASAFTGSLTVNTNNTAATTVTGGAGNDAITATGGSALIETISGGAGNDTVTFTANLAITDVVDGGDGTDTLAGLSANLVGLTSTSTNVSNFETVRVTNALGANLTVANVQAGLTTVRLDLGGTNRTITHEAGTKAIDLRAAVTTALTITDTGTATTDVLTITNNAAATDIFATANLGINGFETVTYNGSGTGNAESQDFGTITLGTDTGGTDTLNLTGSNAITTGVITADVIDASGLTGLGLTMGAAAVDATTITGSAAIDTLVGDANSGTAIDGGAGNDIITGGTGNDTLSGGAGNDTISVSTGSDIVSGGTGDDIITMAAASLSSGDAVDGGDGTDTLNISSIAAIGAAAGQRLSNFERLDLDDAALGGDVTVDLASLINNSAFDRITIGDTNDNVVTVSNVLDAFSDLRLDGSDTTNNDSEAIVTRLVDTSANTMTLTINGGETLKTLTMANEETINISSDATTAATITTLNAADLTTLNLTGTGNVIITNAIGSAASLTTVDASALTAAATVNGSASSSAITFTAGTGIATFTGGVASDTITGGGAADILTGGAGGDTISGGAGTDTINGGAGNDTITGGAGADNFVISSSGATNQISVTDMAVSATGTNDIVQWSLNGGGAIVDGQGIGEGAGALVVTEYDGTATANNAAGSSLIKATALSYNSSADLLTAINNANITVDNGQTGFANNANILATFYDVDGGFASVGTLSSAISATAGVFNSQVTYTETGRLTMSSATYANLDADNFAFIA